MRDLLQVLRDEDSLHWKAVAHAWGVDLGAAGAPRPATRGASHGLPMQAVFIP